MMSTMLRGVALAIARVGGLARRDHRFVALADREQLVLGHDVLAAVLHVVLMDARLHDRIHGAGFFAEAAVDALEQVDVVARRATRAVRRDVGLDRDRERRTYR